MNKKTISIILYVVSILLFIPFLVLYILSVSTDEWGMYANEYYVLAIVIAILLAGIATFLKLKDLKK